MADSAKPTRGPGQLSARQILLLLMAMAATFYCMIAYAGPFKWLAELQLALLGYYEETITFLVTCLILVVPFLLIDWVIRKATDRTETAPEDDIQPTPAWMMAATSVGFGGIIALVGAIMLGLGAWQWWLGRDVTVARVDVAVFETGNAPPQRFVAIQGVAVFEEAVEIKSSSSSGVDYYIPIISLDWKAKSPAAVFVKARETELNDSLRSSRHDWFEGMISTGGLPGMVRTEFERRGPVPARDYFTLDLNRSPADQWRVARDLLAFGAILLVAGVSTSIVQARRRSVGAAPVLRPGGADPRLSIKTLQSSPGHQAPDGLTGDDGIDLDRGPAASGESQPPQR